MFGSILIILLHDGKMRKRWRRKKKQSERHEWESLSTL